ncbi:hypothetical protein N665_0917s0005 [Sinapis alba]|nr:hypothetical protein N665_0917s0005 [Sinapis alba]
MLTAFPYQLETGLQKIQGEICHTFTRESQVQRSQVRLGLKGGNRKASEDGEENKEEVR